MTIIYNFFILTMFNKRDFNLDLHNCKYIFIIIFSKKLYVFQ